MSESPVFNILLSSVSTDEESGGETRTEAEGCALQEHCLAWHTLDVSSCLQQKHGSSGSYRFSLQLIPICSCMSVSQPAYTEAGARSWSWEPQLHPCVAMLRSQAQSNLLSVSRQNQKFL